MIGFSEYAEVRIRERLYIYFKILLYKYMRSRNYISIVIIILVY